MTYILSGLYERATAILVQQPSTSLSELCRMLNVERHSLQRAFRLANGKSLRETRRDIMGEEAIKLLRTAGNLSVKEIAFTMGFGSQRSFGRFIKNLTGLCPTMFRESPLTGNSDAPQMSNKVPLSSRQAP